MIHSPEPPPYKADPLSKGLSDAEFNSRLSIASYPLLYEAFQELDELWRITLEETIHYDRNSTLLISRLLLAQAWGAYRAAVRMILGGQTIPAMPVIRLIVEQSLYALFIAKDPSPPERGEVFLKRSESAKARRECRDLFKTSNIRDCYKMVDLSAANRVMELYEGLIESGAHPNEFPIAASLSITEDLVKKSFALAVLNPSKEMTIYGADKANRAALEALSVITILYPERASIMGLDKKIGVIRSRYVQ